MLVQVELLDRASVQRQVALWERWQTMHPSGIAVRPFSTQIGVRMAPESRPETANWSHPGYVRGCER